MPESDLASLPPVFRYRDALAAGISAERLYAYRDRGIIEQVSRGLYRQAVSQPNDLDLVEIAHRVPSATICLITALSRHDLTDIIPHRTDIAIPRGARVPRLSAPTSIHVFNRDTFGIGRNEIDLHGEGTIGLYSPERTIVDMIRLRHNEGPEVAWEALRRWLRRRGSSPAALLEVAKHFRGAERAVRTALDIVL